MKINAYAKINLGLHITAKRPDGFHNIETIFHRINLFDEIEILNSSTISITTTNREIPTDNNNLCWKAVDLLQKELKVKSGAVIHIQKNIPVGAGLGGGSSDAAAVLQSLPIVWNEDIERTRLGKLALQLGSDVPYFLGSTTAYGKDRGESLQQIPLKLPQWIVLVNPKIHISTQWAYAALSEKRNGVFPVRPKMIEQFSLSPFQTILQSDNDFEEVVFDKYPKVKEIKTKLLRLGAAHALMSGSGSSVFGLFEDRSRAVQATELFEKEYFVHLTEPYFTLQQNE